LEIEVRTENDLRFVLGTIEFLTVLVEILDVNDIFRNAAGVCYYVRFGEESVGEEDTVCEEDRRMLRHEKGGEVREIPKGFLVFLSYKIDASIKKLTKKLN
jgi:hypothetical protein